MGVLGVCESGWEKVTYLCSLLPKIEHLKKITNVGKNVSSVSGIHDFIINKNHRYFYIILELLKIA